MPLDHPLRRAFQPLLRRETRTPWDLQSPPHLVALHRCTGLVRIRARSSLASTIAPFLARILTSVGATCATLQGTFWGSHGARASLEIPPASLDVRCKVDTAQQCDGGGGRQPLCPVLEPPSLAPPPGQTFSRAWHLVPLGVRRRLACALASFGVPHAADWGRPCDDEGSWPPPPRLSGRLVWRGRTVFIISQAVLRHISEEAPPVAVERTTCSADLMPSAARSALDRRTQCARLACGDGS